MSSPTTSPTASRPSPPPLKLRKRATTRALLGDKYKEVITELPEPPKPLNDSAGYTQDRLQQGLQYADAVLRDQARKLTPIGRRVVSVYKDACSQLLSLNREEHHVEAAGFDEVKKECLACIRVFEESRMYLDCLKITNCDGAGELTAELLRLQRTSFYARYGDIFGEACRTLRRQAEVDKIAGWKNLNKDYWTNISTRLGEESPWYQRLVKGEESDEVFSNCSLHLTVSSTCYRLGFDRNDMIAAIHHYAQRNELLHASILPMIRDGNYNDLAVMLRNDYCQVPCLVQGGEIIQEKVLLSVIETMINLWFIRDETPIAIADNPKSWSPSPELKRRASQLRNSLAQDGAKINKEITTQIHKAWTQRLRAEKMDEELNDVFATSMLLSEPKRHVKRVASSQLEDELARAKRQNREWDRLENIAYEVKSMKQAYVNSWGGLVPPPTRVADPLMGEPEPEREPEGRALHDDTKTAAGDIATAVQQGDIETGAGSFESAYRVLESDQPGPD